MHWRRLLSQIVPLLVLLTGLPAVAQEPVVAQAPRKIPGITAEDPFPGACVNCHVVIPEGNQDVRLSNIMRTWSEAVDPALVARVRHTAPAGVELKGKHPVLKPSVFQDVPRECLECHGRGADEAPPFARMIHAIHLQGGEANHFLTMFQGECTLCHKLNAQTGAWSIPSGPERQ